MMAETRDRLSELEERVALLADQNERLLQLVTEGDGGGSRASSTALGRPSGQIAGDHDEDVARPQGPGGVVSPSDDGEEPPSGLDRRSALRGLGTAAAAAVGLVAANGVVRPAPASAADGDALTIGQFNSGSSSTRLSSEPTSGFEGSAFAATFSGLNDAVPDAGDYSYGLRGRATGGPRSHGVIGRSNDGMGVVGWSESVGGVGVFGEATGSSVAVGKGVHGSATGRGGDGVFGEAAGDSVTPAYGVRGVVSDSIRGGAAVRGTNTGGGYAVQGRSAESGGVGVYGWGGGTGSENYGVGVLARADYGAPLLLRGASIAVPPDSGSWDAGSFLFRDGELWICEDSGSPGTWRRLHSSGFSNYLDFITPVRVMNTLSGGKNHPTGSQGTPLTGDPNDPFTVDISGELPEGATAMYASVTAVPVTARGWVTAWESGAWPEVANLTWENSQNITNLSLIGLTPSDTFQLTLQSGRTAHVVIDALAIVRND